MATTLWDLRTWSLSPLCLAELRHLSHSPLLFIKANGCYERKCHLVNLLLQSTLTSSISSWARQRHLALFPWLWWTQLPWRPQASPQPLPPAKAPSSWQKCPLDGNPLQIQTSQTARTYPDSKQKSKLTLLPRHSVALDTLVPPDKLWAMSTWVRSLKASMYSHTRSTTPLLHPCQKLPILQSSDR